MGSLWYSIITAIVGIIVIYAVLNRLSSYLCNKGFKHLCHLGDITMKVGAILGALYLAYVILPYAPLSAFALRSLNKVIAFTAIIVITWYVVILLEKGIREYLERKHTAVLATGLTITIMKILILSLGILIALESVGISITPIITTLGIGGLAVALALQDILANLFSGMLLVISKDINVGDFIKIDDETQGFIEDISLRNTVIRRAFDGANVIVPNSKVVNAAIVNFQKGNDGSYGLAIPVGVSYDANLKKVREITLQVAKEVVNEVEDADKSFEPIVRFDSFGDSAINFKVLFKSKTLLGRFAIIDKFIEKLKEVYDKEDIEIPYPKQDIYIKEMPKEQ
ncbi:mechanosensitive ion channel [bacterium 3DAC]|nr:mechanosensitive ion channel [bacterium 3DAC]